MSVVGAATRNGLPRGTSVASAMPSLAVRTVMGLTTDWSLRGRAATCSLVCRLDEMDAALDEENQAVTAKWLRSDTFLQTQVICVSHRPAFLDARTKPVRACVPQGPDRRA